VSLRTRLWLVLGGLFLVPIVVGVLVVTTVVMGARDNRATTSLDVSSDAVTAELADDCTLTGVLARDVGFEAGGSSPQEAVDAVVAPSYGDYAALLGPGDRVVAEAGTLPEGVDVSGLPSCSRARGSDPSVAVVADIVPVSGVEGVESSVVARRLDADGLRELRRRGGTGDEVVLLADGQVVASSLSRTAAEEVATAVDGRTGTIDAEGWNLRVQGPARGVPFTVVVAMDDTGSGDTAWLVGAILLAGALAAGLLVSVVARGLSQPFTDLTEAAERVAKGDLDTSVAASDEGEAGRLGSAFNQMTGELRRSLSELERSRADLHDSLERIGEALRSTHDLDGLLSVVLETATATLGATAGVVLYRRGDQLELMAEQGLHEASMLAPAVVSPGHGVLGRVVSRGIPVRGRIGTGDLLMPAEGEPSVGDVLAVPLVSMGSSVGVIALYDRTDRRAFDTTDEESLTTLAGQASIAIDNVHFHNEAQRLSTTDPLTGLWNFRYLSMSLAREIERSTRFDRPLAVLMLDLDHFKQVNDAHGHQRGDTVLRELASRVQEQIREVDTFARYGGEEFVVVLPETTVEGAAQLADRICQAVRREPFRHDGEEPLHVTVSVGGAAFPEHGSSPATLMRAADRALYVAKNAGRNRWHVPGADHEVAR
jgi:two-component system, cell cycle response regulator